MEHDLKLFLARVRPRETRELAQDHITRVVVDRGRQRATLHVDKRYAFNLIISHEHIARLIAAVKRAFGDSFGTVIQLEVNRSQAEREKAIPHTVHYH